MKTLEKIRSGLPLVRAFRDKINEIVDYLRATRIVQGTGILVSESATGIVISVNGSSRTRDEDDYAFVTAGPGICISGTSETPAVSGGTNSTVPVDGATFSLLLEAGTDNVVITDGVNGSKVISVTGSTAGGSSGPGYPDYIALCTFPSGVSVPSGITGGIGTTYLLPVRAGVSIKYYSPVADTIALYAPALEETGNSGGTSTLLTNDTAFTPMQKGWVRISILDDGQNEGACLRFYVGTSDWTKALPLYRCGSFGPQGATGINASISGHTASITLSGGSGSVNLVGSGSVEISGGSSGEIIIHGSSSGSSGESALNFVTSVGIVILTGSSRQLVYCPQATDSGGYKLNQYNFTAPGTATIDALNAAAGKSLVNTGQFDDAGNIIFVLPENPATLTSIDIRLTSGSTEVIVCTVDGKKIVDAGGGQQGVTNGVCDDGMDGGNHYMYVYITSISGFPEYYDANGNESYIAQYVELEGGCWVRLDIDN
jgi:hypothetical protein